MKSIVLIGNPGVGKSYLLNILGGKFKSGFSAVSGITEDLGSQEVEVEGEKLKLVNLPGVLDADTSRISEFIATVLKEVKDSENLCICFVICLNIVLNLENKDRQLIKYMKRKLEISENVYLVINKIHKKHINDLKNPIFKEKEIIPYLEKSLDMKFSPEKVLLIPKSEEIEEEKKIEVRNFLKSMKPVKKKEEGLISWLIGLIKEYLF